MGQLCLDLLDRRQRALELLRQLFEVLDFELEIIWVWLLRTTDGKAQTSTSLMRSFPRPVHSTSRSLYTLDALR